MSFHPFAVVTKGFSSLGLEVGYALKKNFAVAFFDKFDSEKRNQVINDGLSYSYLNTESETDINQTMQAVLVCFANVRLLVNIIEPQDIIGSSTFRTLENAAIKEKVSAFVEGTVGLIRVVALQMSCQTDQDGFKGHVINIINCGTDSDSKLLSSMVSGALTSMTTPLAKLLKPYCVRMNTIIIEPNSTEKTVIIPGQAPSVESETDMITALFNLIEDPVINSLNIRLRKGDARL